MCHQFEVCDSCFFGKIFVSFFYLSNACIFTVKLDVDQRSIVVTLSLCYLQYMNHVERKYLLLFYFCKRRIFLFTGTVKWYLFRSDFFLLGSFFYHVLLSSIPEDKSLTTRGRILTSRRPSYKSFTRSSVMSVQVREHVWRP